MPFRKTMDQLAEELRKARELEVAAIDRLHAYLKSESIDVARLKELTQEMIAHCERSALMWRELQNIAPADAVKS